MVFECQRNPYKTEFCTTVVSCTPSSLETLNNGKKEKIECFEIVLEDTILFPEGGGQPDDRGTLNGIPVLRVTRRGLNAVHFTQLPLEKGSSTEVRVDWARRWDHMQQHSGQHLITAITDNLYGFKTTSWWLGEQTSYIELDTATVTEDQLSTIESTVNEKIRQSTPVEAHVFDNKENMPNEVRTRGLPADHQGPVRVVEMKGIDTNMCCGTHVSNLSHLQVIKLLYAEKGKKNKTNLFFACGKRVLDYCSTAQQRERQLTTLLKNGPEDHVDLVSKLQSSLRVAQKNLQSLMREVASAEAARIKASTPLPKCHFVHRKDGDMDFINVLVSELSQEDLLLLVTVGEDNNGHMVLTGPVEKIQQLGPKICEVFQGKGVAKGRRFQGKISRLTTAARSQAAEMLNEA